MDNTELISEISPVQKRWRPTVEPLIFIVSMATAISALTTQNFFLQRICEHEFTNGTFDVLSFCHNLTHYKQQEAEVEAIAGVYGTYRTFMTAGPPMILALVWGQLNDRFGSKRMLFIPLMGYLISNVIFFILTYFQASHPALLLLAIVPDSVTGGSVALTISLFKLVVHTSTPEERTFRIGVAEGAMLVANPIGMLIGAKILETCGFGPVFLMSGALHILGMVSAWLFVIDDGPSSGSSESSENESSSCWSLEKLKESARAFGPHKTLLCLLIFIPSVRVFVMGGNGTIMMNYTRFKFDWDPLAFSSFSTFGGIVSALGLLAVSTIAMKILHVSDAFLGAVASLSFAIGCSVWAFASSPWFMYFGSAIQLCQGISIIIVRSMISGIVPTEDVGKALSLLSIPENLMPFISTPLYTAIYNATVTGFIGTAFLVSTYLNASVVLAYLYIYLAFPPSATRNPQPHYDEVDSDHEHTQIEETETRNNSVQAT